MHQIQTQKILTALNVRESPCHSLRALVDVSESYLRLDFSLLYSFMDYERDAAVTWRRQKDSALKDLSGEERKWLSMFRDDEDEKFAHYLEYNQRLLDSVVQNREGMDLPHEFWSHGVPSEHQVIGSRW